MSNLVEAIPNFNNTSTLLDLGFILAIAILSMSIHKFNQPSVLGQIIAGCVIAIFKHYHLTFFINLSNNQILLFFAQLGSIFLLFDIGLESNFYEIKNTGKYALTTSLIGIIIPFFVGYYVIAKLILHSDSLPFSLLIGGILSVTSTGISVTIFKELGLIKTKECQLVLAASIFDDILGLIILSLIVGIITSGAINFTIVISPLINTILFFGLAFLIYRVFINKFIDKYLIKISRHYDMLPLTLVTLCLLFAYFASYLNLNYTIGAFIAGLILDIKYFNNYDKAQIKDTDIKVAVSTLGKILTPIFFIYAGMQIDLINAFNWQTIELGLLISILAIFSKSICGIFLPTNINKWLVGFSMVPRGEIGIIFAVTGLELKIINYEFYTILLFMIIITSLVTPIILNKLIKKQPLTNN